MKIIINGCFDLLHRGHVHLINTALKYSDNGKVLLLLNSDESIKALKGDRRPLEHVTIRAEAIEKAFTQWCHKTLEYPQLTVQVFNNEEELNKAIDRFEPDIIMKGDDRPDVRDIVGYGRWPIMFIPVVRAKHGGKISSTEIARKRGL